MISSTSARSDDRAVIGEFQDYYQDLYSTLYNRYLSIYEEDHSKVDDLFNDAKIIAAIYGYALYRVKEIPVVWDDSHESLYIVLRRHCEDQIYRFSNEVMKSRNWDEWDRAGHEAKALQIFQSFIAGNEPEQKHKMDQVASFRTAPDLLTKYSKPNAAAGIRLVGIYNKGFARIKEISGSYIVYERSPLHRHMWATKFKLNLKPDSQNGNVSRWTAHYQDSNLTWRSCTATYNKVTETLELRYANDQRKTFMRIR